MANDTPTIDQQVAQRPDQTAPVTLPAALQPDTAATPAAFSGWDKLVAKQGQEPAGWKNLVSDTGHVSMLTPDGSKSGDVPLPNVQKAREAGFHIAIPMKAPDGQKGWVPYHRIADAMSSGFTHANDKLATAGDELVNLTSAGLLPAFLKTPKGKEINEAFNQEIQGILHDPEKRTNFLVGLVQPGGGEGGEGLREGLTEGASAAEAAIKKAGMVYKGELSPGSGVHMVEHPNHPGKTGAVNEPVTPEKVTDAVNAVLKRFGVKAEAPETARETLARQSAKPVQVPPETTAGQYDAAIKQAGAVPGGISKGDEVEPDSVNFHDPKTGSTLGLPVDQVTPERVQQEMAKSRVQFGKATVAEGADAFNLQRGQPSIEASVKSHDPEFAARVADAYDALKHNPNDPEVQAAYGAMKNDIRAQWDYANQKMGIKFEPWETSFDYKKSFNELKQAKEQPYANSKEMMDDVNNNHHLYFFQGGTMTPNHPLAEVDPETGYSYNDMLRAVHDLFGHAAHGFQFGPKGEENAYLVHRQMFSPEAIPALTTETRAQNSWFNYGAHLRNAEGKVPAKGEAGYVPTSERPFAENKAALLPSEFQVRTAEAAPAFAAPTADMFHMFASPEEQAAGFEPGKWNIPEHIKPIVKAMEVHSAGAIDPRTGGPELTGQGLHGLEVVPESRQRYANRPTDRDVAAFSEANAALFAKHPELRLGWDRDPVNHPDQPWELNIGAAGTPEGAAAVGKRLDQRAAYNIDRGVDVPLGGKNQQTQFSDYPLEDRLRDLKGAKTEPTEVKGIAKLDQPLEADYANAKPIAYPWGAEFNNRTAAGMVFPDGRIVNARLAHMDIAHAAGYNDPEASDNLTDFLKDSGAARIIYPEFGEGNIGLELHKPPTDAQLQVIADNLKRATKSGTGDGSVTWDLALPNGKYQSGTGTIGDFQRAVDKWKEPEAPAQAAPKDLGKATTQTVVKGSTVSLRTNPLTVEPSGDTEKPSTADVALELAKYTRKQLPMLEYGKAKPATQIARAKSIAEDEAKYQLAQNNTGEHWYTKDMEGHDKTAIDMRPELADPTKLSLFKFVEGVLSSGQKPYANFKSAVKAWDAYADTGEFPTSNPDTGKSWGPRGERAYGSAIDSINRLIQEKGEQGAAEWLRTEHPVKELHSYMTPTQTRVAGKADDLQPGAMILGPKRGPFSLNLHGKETAFTADMWVSRIWHRWMGTTEIGPDGDVITDSPRSNKERSLMRQSFDETAQKLGITTSSLQAVLWYYEQALYHVHGAAKESWNFADAAKRVADEEFSTLNFGEPEAPVTGKKK